MITVKFDTPITRGETTIASVDIRKPAAGDLRGLNLMDVAQLKTDTMIKLLPRVTQPALTETEVADKLDLSDFMACAVEVAGFLATRAQLQASPEA